VIARECDNNVSFLLHEVEELIGGQSGAKAFRFGGEEDDMVISTLAVTEEREFICLW
jgi:hypothetical protein